jgi:hypothetical protein
LVWLSHGESASVYPGMVFFQLSFTVFGLLLGVQTSLLNSFIVAALTADGLPKLVGAAVDEGLALALALGLALGVAVDFAVELAFAVAVAVAVAVALADVVAVGVALGLASLAAETSEVDAFGLAVEPAEVLTAGVGDTVDLAVPVPLGEGDGEPVPVLAGVVGPVYGSVSRTGRKVRKAVALTVSMMLVAAWPGIVTVTWLSPCCATSAPELPVPFTRLSRTVMAACISPADGGLPLWVAAWSTTWVPLDRSSPRPTLNWLCQLAGLNVWAPRIEISMIKISAAIPASARPGREPLLLGGATICLPG